MIVNLVLSAFTSSPISLLANIEASAFSFTECTFPPNILTPEADVYHLISSHPGLPEPS
jgi:hypothetical protein